jgi:hypothetical protein
MINVLVHNVVVIVRNSSLVFYKKNLVSSEDDSNVVIDKAQSQFEHAVLNRDSIFKLFRSPEPVLINV